MNSFLGQVDSSFNPVMAGLLAAAGLVVGGLIYISISGALFGLVCALGLYGVLGLVTAAVASATGADLDSDRHSAGQRIEAASNRAPPTSTSASAADPANEAAPPASTETVSDTAGEAALLSSGQFAEYHLAKAKRLYGARKFKEAATQASASLAHDSLPEASQLRRAAIDASR